MKFIICGAGRVGFSIAEYLVQENNEITIIDTDPDLIGHINDVLDVKGIVGHAPDPDILSTARAGDCDMIMALTGSDEVNMVACQVAHSLFNIPRKLARIREKAYLRPGWSNLFSRSHMPIDVIISPEIIIAQDIYQRLSLPGTTYAMRVASEKAYLVGFICHEDCSVLNTQISQITEIFPDLEFKILTVKKDHDTVLPDMTEQLRAGDEVFLFVNASHLERVLSIFGIKADQAHKVVIAGGGYIGCKVAELLGSRGQSTKLSIIEKENERARQINETLPNNLVINADILERGIMTESGVDHAEAFISVTEDDKSNILAALLAKKNGAKNVIALVNNEVYASLIKPMDIDSVIYPKEAVVAVIMQHIRRGRIRDLHSMRGAFAEIIEAEVTDQTSVSGMTVEDIELTGEVMVIGVIRDNTLILTKRQETIEPNDIIIILVVHAQIPYVEKLLSVQVDLF